MIIVFYSVNDEQVYICNPLDKTQIVSSDDPDLLKYIPDDDILYVTNGHYLTRQQFTEWLTSDKSPEKRDLSPALSEDRKYIHPVHNGTVIIEDIKTPRFPNGIILEGKWDFLPVDEIGEEILEASIFYRGAIKKRKIEVVDEKYRQKHAHKKVSTSRTEAALNRILIKDSRPGAAEVVASSGGLANNEIAVPIIIG